MPNLARALGYRAIQYDPGPPDLDHCAGHIQPGTEQVSAQTHACFPVRDIPGDGYNCRPVNHVPGNPPSVHGSGRAEDFGMPLLLDGVYVPYGTPGARFDTSVGDRVAEFLIKYAGDLQVQSIVFNRRSWSPNRIPGWRSYSGSTDHVDHLHMEQNNQGAAMSVAEVDLVFRRAGLLPTLEEVSEMLIVPDPTDLRPNPTNRRFARLLGDRRTVRGVNGARLQLSATGPVGKEVRLPWVAQGIVLEPDASAESPVFGAYEKNDGGTTGLRFVAP